MEIRTATKNDLPEIMQLREEFGHSMLYQYFPEVMEKYLDRIIVAEDLSHKVPTNYLEALDTESKEIVGYYHYIVSGDPGFYEMLKCYRQLPDNLIFQADRPSDQLCVVMQGACHRDAFEEIIEYLQSKYPEVWCWNSITNPDKPSGKIEGYKSLGFIYREEDKHTFFNVHKGDYSTYRLGRWIRQN